MYDLTLPPPTQRNTHTATITTLILRKILSPSDPQNILSSSMALFGDGHAQQEKKIYRGGICSWIRQTQ